MKYCVTINNKRYEVEVEKGEAAIVSTTEDTPVAAVYTEIAAAEADKAVRPVEKAAETGISAGKEVVKAPMAGAIIDIKVSVGSSVQIGDTLLLLEAMKMENEITAHVDGVVADIKVKKGMNVSAQDIIMVIK